MALNGSLDDYSPAGALRVLSSGARTGAVRFHGDAGCTVYLHRGQLYFARDELTDHALAAALVRPGRLTPEEWGRCVAEAGDQPCVGELIVAGGMIDPDLLASVVLSVVYDPLIRLFREGDGAFDFEEGTVHWMGPFRSFNVDAIANEVRRRVREVDEMAPLVPTIDAWVRAQRTLPGNAAQVSLLREDWELVTALGADGRSIAELAGEMGRGRYSTARVVHRLAQAGLVGVTVAHATPSFAAPSDLDLPAHVEPVVEMHSATADDLGEADTWAEPVAGDEPVAPHRGFDPHPAISEEEAIGGWALPKRSVAVDDQPGERTSPWPESEDLAMDDPAAQPSRTGLLGTAFRNAVGTDGQPTDQSPNAEWLQSLYQEYMDEPDAAPGGTKKEAIEVAFAAEEQDSATKIPTLRRLMDALKKL